MSFRISTEKMREGIEHSLEKSLEHLEGAEACLSVDNLNGAVALIEFAIEEFGRAVALKEKLDIGSEKVERTLFSSHKHKYDKAWTVLPQKLKAIYEGTFSESEFEPDAFEVGGETISPRTRLDAVFIDYDEATQEWKTGIRADKSTLEHLIEEIRQACTDFRT